MGGGGRAVQHLTVGRQVGREGGCAAPSGRRGGGSVMLLEPTCALALPASSPGGVLAFGRSEEGELISTAMRLPSGQQSSFCINAREGGDARGGADGRRAGFRGKPTGLTCRRNEVPRCLGSLESRVVQQVAWWAWNACMQSPNKSDWGILEFMYGAPLLAAESTEREHRA